MMNEQNNKNKLLQMITTPVIIIFSIVGFTFLAIIIVLLLVNSEKVESNNIPETENLNVQKTENLNVQKTENLNVPETEKSFTVSSSNTENTEQQIESSLKSDEQSELQKKQELKKEEEEIDKSFEEKKLLEQERIKQEVDIKLKESSNQNNLEEFQKKKDSVNVEKDPLYLYWKTYSSDKKINERIEELKKTYSITADKESIENEVKQMYQLFCTILGVECTLSSSEKTQDCSGVEKVDEDNVLSRLKKLEVALNGGKKSDPGSIDLLKPWDEEMKILNNLFPKIDSTPPLSTSTHFHYTAFVDLKTKLPELYDKLNVKFNEIASTISTVCYLGFYLNQSSDNFIPIKRVLLLLKFLNQDELVREITEDVNSKIIDYCIEHNYDFGKHVPSEINILEEYEKITGKKDSSEDNNNGR